LCRKTFLALPKIPSAVRISRRRTESYLVSVGGQC
jgi:hypothetical protein